MDANEALARELHRQVNELEQQAKRLRMQRNAIVRRLYAEPRHSYVTLSVLLGCSKELIAHIVRTARQDSHRNRPEHPAGERAGQDNQVAE